MNVIRSLTGEDIPAVAALFHKVHLANDATTAKSSLDAIGAEFEEIFLRNPWRDENLPSLVCEDENGAILGFIGVTPRRMSIKGRIVVAAVSAHLMIEPGRRTELAGVRLLQRFLSGPQELSITDFANDIGRKVWDGAGGKMFHTHSLQCVKSLRPAAQALSLAAGKFRLLRRFSPITRPLCQLSDATLARMEPGRFHFSPSDLIPIELDDETLLALISRFGAFYSLRPEYELSSLSWLIRRAEKINRRGNLRKIALRDASGAIAGWYLYYLNPGGASEVLQLCARRAAGAVLDHLFHHAWSNGSVSVSGRLEPQMLPALSSRKCYLKCGSPWVMIHSRDPEIFQAIERSDAFLSKLDGEWCTSYQA